MIKGSNSDKGSLDQRSIKCEGITHIVNCLQEVCFRQSGMPQGLACLRFTKEATVEERRRADAPNNGEGPQAREPSKCLNGQSYREILTKEAF